MSLLLLALAILYRGRTYADNTPIQQDETIKMGQEAVFPFGTMVVTDARVLASPDTELTHSNRVVQISLRTTIQKQLTLMVLNINQHVVKTPLMGMGSKGGFSQRLTGNTVRLVYALPDQFSAASLSLRLSADYSGIQRMQHKRPVLLIDLTKRGG
ncbi:hypothetical protein L248_2690 [Schleiferilactobacillus shenzhenensis LY-73]|uniref:Uncharacterized protein n=1 Tax=Schleiferilactobacillus shenzhenensis LY-73 TaxID=1231336 RepID=U4TKB5_9LACO|nr:hypothetical protein L248_2690 [Schleiferilactobacillus shenzhenensis LY-73]